MEGSSCDETWPAVPAGGSSGRPGAPGRGLHLYSSSMRPNVLFRLPAAAAALAVFGCASVPTPAPSTASLVIAATTDVHGRLRAWDYYANAADPARGLARAATIVDSLRAAHPGQVVLVDAGDLLQGNPMTYVAARIAAGEPHPVAAAMNVMRYDAAAIGNHEFNYGLPLLEKAVSEAQFPFLAANAYRTDGTRAFRAWHMVERDGARVGIVGATNPGSMIWDRDNLTGRLVVRDIVPEVRTAVAEARAAGADVVVAVLHSGLDAASSYDTVSTGLPSENVSARVAREVPGIDVLVVGHSHQEVADTTINGVLVVQPKNWATSVSVAHLSLVRADGAWRVTGKRAQLVQARGRSEHAGVIAATAAMHDRTVAYVTAPIGTTPVQWRSDSARLKDTPIVDFTLEVMRRTAGTELASTAAFSTEATLGPGPVTVAQVAALYPYENTLRAIRISGRQLREYLEFSSRYYRQSPDGRPVPDQAVPGYNFDIVAGVEYGYDLARPVGQRLTHLTRSGRPVADTDSFTFALNNYRQTGGGGYAMLAGAPVIYESTDGIREMLIEEVRARGTLRPEDYFVRNWGIAGVAGYEAPRTAAPGTGALTVPVRKDPAPRTAGGVLRIISTNDFHGSLEARADDRGIRRGGAAHLATAIRNAERECAAQACEVLLLDGGDEFQGTPASNLAFGRPVVDVFNAVGYAAAALGNHEFDWGQDTLRARMRQARYAILGANARFEDGRDVPWIPNDTIVTRGPYRIGIVGIATTETKRTTGAQNTMGLRFDSPAPIVDSIARSLRSRGVDAVVVVAHAGGRCDTACGGEIIDFARNLSEPVDAIVSGHSHTMLNTQVSGIPIIQARSHGRAIAVLDVPMSGAAGRRGGSATVRDVLSDSLPGDASTQRLVDAVTAPIRELVERRIAEFRDALPREADEQYALGNLIADAQRWGGRGDIALMNNGGIRANHPAGVATYGSLFEIQPFANRLMRVVVPGSALRDYFERAVRANRPRIHVSGIRIEFDTTAAPGSRIISLTMADGSPLVDTKDYVFVLSDFLYTGGDGLGLARVARSAEELGLVDLEILIEYLRTLPQPVIAPAETRIQARSGR